ncbi:TIGR03086 family metal-binding protein [Streptacidiphilus anmyonensis]|uniref:TIGR03086 family metal-binding protein n=1 Tax=Streptacidiphilus anmyonensis TaxID=405782 RepID=UPI000694EE7E|nr:TIGR03086 family metal-binding protein [Streptacidiphilus anmyonensis]
MQYEPTPVELADRLTRAARGLQDLATERRLAGKRGRPTPCGRLDVHRLCEHLLATMVRSTYAAARKPVPEGAPVTLTDAPWRVYPPVVDRLVAAWSKPAAWEGEGVREGELAVLELTVHGWDLAQATGQGFKAADDVVATAAAAAERLAPQARATGAFGPELPAPVGATALERLLAFTGRQAG